MGCFSACFGTSKNPKHPKSADSTPSGNQNLFQGHGKCEALQPTKLTEEAKIVNHSIKPISEQKDTNEGQLNSSIKKKVTFDLNIISYGEVSVQEQVTDCSTEMQKEKETEEVKEAEEETEDQSQALSDSSISSMISLEFQKDKWIEKEETGNQSQALSDSSTSSMISYPPIHRYHNCRNSDDEFEDKDEDNSTRLVQDESSESLFSLSIESRKQVNAVEIDDDKEVNSPMLTFQFPPEGEIKLTGLNPNGRDRSQYVRSVLNPIENLGQWKAAKARTAAATPSPLTLQDKENINFDQENVSIPFSDQDPSFKQRNHNLKINPNEIAVDTSLSSWLIESEKTPRSQESTNSSCIGNLLSQKANSNSSRSFEDRPILGALTVEELKQFSASSSPRQSPSHSPHDMPIIGTVGSYWSHTGQTMNSSSSSSCKAGQSGKRKMFREEDGNMKCHSTPFGTRLERANSVA